MLTSWGFFKDYIRQNMEITSNVRHSFNVSQDYYYSRKGQLLALYKNGLINDALEYS